MSETPHDIKDDEIRIISAENKGIAHIPQNRSKRRRPIIAILIAAAVIGIVAIGHVIKVTLSDGNANELELVTNEIITEEYIADDYVSDTVAAECADAGFVTLSDTVINGVALSVLTPINLTPTLQIGTEALNDSTVRFVVQAADIRGDNGGIVGAYVNKGELISKGQTKSGFCAIISGNINIGVAEATPFLEQALENDGYFFRQYPLVIANQVIENKPKGKALRRALAEIDGCKVVIMSKNRMTFHDFSRSLVDLGVTDAIYLVGGKGYGYAIDQDGKKIEFGQKWPNPPANINYLVWK